MFLLVRAFTVGMMVLALGSGCGVRQFNSKNKPTESLPPENQQAKGHFLDGYGPFYSAGQGGGSMSSAGCNPNAHHPCTRARASVGMPYQYDTNPNQVQAPITSGTGYPAGGPYAGTAGGADGSGAGKTKTAALQPSNRGGTLPRAENRDLHIISRQTASGTQSF